MAKKKKVQKDKQRSAKHTHKTKDRITLTSLKTKNAAFRSKIKDCLARNQDNMSKCCDMSIRVPTRDTRNHQLLVICHARSNVTSLNLSFKKRSKHNKKITKLC